VIIEMCARAQTGWFYNTGMEFRPVRDADKTCLKAQGPPIALTAVFLEMQSRSDQMTGRRASQCMTCFISQPREETRPSAKDKLDYGSLVQVNDTQSKELLRPRLVCSWCSSVARE
jgi:hypothetical protein